MDVHPPKNVSIGIDPYPNGFNTTLRRKPRTPGPVLAHLTHPHRNMSKLPLARLITPPKQRL